MNYEAFKKFTRVNFQPNGSTKNEKFTRVNFIRRPK